VGLAWAKLKLLLKIDFYRDLQSSWPFLNAAVDMRVNVTHTHTHLPHTHQWLAENISSWLKLDGNIFKDPLFPSLSLSLSLSVKVKPNVGHVV